MKPFFTVEPELIAAFGAIKGSDAGSRHAMDRALHLGVSVMTLPVTLEEEKIVVKGSEFASLGELLESYETMRFHLDLSQCDLSIVKPLISLLQQKSCTHRVIISAQKKKLLKKIRALLPEVATVFSPGEIIFFYFLLRAGLLSLGLKKKFGGDMLLIPESIGPSQMATAPFIGEAQKRNITVAFWDVKTKEELLRLKAMGVKSFATQDVEAFLNMV